MNNIDVTVVRVYFSEGEKLLEKLLKYLKDEVQVRGVTVFRGISGFGDDKTIHSAAIVALSLNLPLVVEFFDEKSKITGILEELATFIKPEHLLYWDATSNE